MATIKRTSKNTAAKYEALQNELETLQDELDNNSLQQEELQGIAESLQQRIEVLEEQLEERSYSDEDNEE